MAKARRAKKTKLSKKLIYTVPILAIIVIFITLICNKNEINLINTLSNKSAKAYNSYVTDTYTQSDGMKILPIKYSNTYDQIKKSDIEKSFKSAGITIKSFSSDKITTGTKIETNRGTYVVVIYGDTNCDGMANILDAIKVIDLIVNDETSKLVGANRLATNIAYENQNDINILDVIKLIQFIVGNESIINTLPESDIHKDKEPPVITLKGEDPMTIKVGQKFVDPGADVYDKVDPKPTLTAKSEVNNTRSGKYKVIYTAKDANGNTSTKERTVIVIDDSEPQITLKGKEKEIVNVFEEYTDPGATATDKEDGNLTPKIDTSKVDTNIPGTYEVTITATNSRNKTTTVKRIVEVINYATSIKLTDTNEQNPVYNEEDTLNALGIKATITKKYKPEETEEVSDLSKLDSTYKLIVNPEKAVYDESEDSKNDNIELSVQVKYINPVDETKNVESDTIKAHIRVIGKIREFTNSMKQEKVEGEIYSTFEIAKLTTPKNQEKIKYINSDDSSNVSVKIEKQSGEVVTGEEPKVVIETAEEGESTVKIYGTDAGEYKVTISSEKGAEEVINVSLKESTIVNGVRIIKDQDISLKEGKSTDVLVEFTHVYTKENQEKDERLIGNVVKNRITLESNSKLTIKLLGAEDRSSYKELGDEDGEEVVLGIRITANENSVEGDKPDSTENTEVVFKIKNDPGKEEEGRVNITIQKKSMFTAYVEEGNRNIDLYLKKDDLSDVFQDNGDIYTPIPIILRDQYYGKNDKLAEEEKKAKAEDLTTKVSDLSLENKIAFVDLARGDENNPSYIKLIGLKKEGDSYQKVESGEIDYVGIAISELGIDKDEDDELEQNNVINLCQRNGKDVVLQININNIYRKEITTLNQKVLNNNIYCYEENEAAVSVETGKKEENITPDDIEVTVTPEEGIDNIEKKANGKKVDIIITGANEGKYTVKTKLLGHDGIEASSEINIIENSIVDEIKFEPKDNISEKDENGNIFFGKIRIGKALVRNIEYYHIYHTKNGDVHKKISVKNAPSADKIELSTTTQGIVHKLNGSLILDDETEWGDAHIERILVSIEETANTGKSDLKINIYDKTAKEDPQRKPTCSETVALEIIEKAELTGIKITPVNSKGEKLTDITAHLYKNIPKEELNAKEAVYKGKEENHQYVYTIFKVELVDSDGDLNDIIGNSFKNTLTEEKEFIDGLTIRDNINETATREVPYVDVILMDYNEKTGFVATSTENIRYIGIASMEPDSNPIEKLKVYYKDKAKSISLETEINVETVKNDEN